MNDTSQYIRLPAGLSEHPLALRLAPLQDDEFVAHQVEFIRRIFAYCTYLQENGRETPVSDAFLGVFVNLFEVMDVNSPEDARRCVFQLSEVFRVIFPGFDSAA